MFTGVVAKITDGRLARPAEWTRLKCSPNNIARICALLLPRAEHAAVAVALHQAGYALNVKGQ